MSEIELALYVGFVCFLIGGTVGTYLQANKWASNADRIQRIEWRGRLYKVNHAQSKEAHK